MKRKRSNIILLASALLFTSSLSSCSSFFGEDGYMIKETSVIEDSNGNEIFVIKFNDETVSDMRITIPKGEDGNSIETITPTIKDNEVVLTIKYSDETKKDTVVSVPIINGKDGKGVRDITIKTNSEGNMVLKFIYTDNTESNEIVIPKGKDGVGIKSIVPTFDNATNKTTIIITFTDESISPVKFEVSNGKDGVGIKTITYSEEYSTEDSYCLVIEYNDGYITTAEDSIYLPRPKATEWYSGASDPSATIGKSGDFYINIVNGNVFQKNDSGKWEYKFSMKSSSESEDTTYTTVIFDANGGLLNDSTTTASLYIEEGEALKLSMIPTPTKEGSTFLGWYTSKKYNVNAGKLTDLTPVYGTKLSVYAWWSE